MARRLTRYPEAHDLYLRGRYLWDKLLRARDRDRSRLRARLVRAGRRLLVQPDQRRRRDVLAALAETSRARYQPPYASALVHAGLGEHDLAFAWLDRAYDARVHVVYLPVDPKWDPLRADARFPAFLERCGLVAPAVLAR